MRSLHVTIVMLAASPYFMEQIAVRRLYAAMQIVDEATIFAARGRNKGTQFRFEQRFLVRTRATNHN